MASEVKVGQRNAALVVSKRLPVTLAEIGGVMGRAFGEVYGHLGARRAEPQGPPFVIYHGTPASGEPFEIEVCAPVARAVDPPAGWQMQELLGSAMGRSGWPAALAVRQDTQGGAGAVESRADGRRWWD